MTRRGGRAAKGFSLAEMMAAVTIFGLGVLGTLEVFTVSLQSTSSSLNYTQAVMLAQSLMEETIAEGDLSEGETTGDFGEGYPQHSWALEIVETDTSGLYQVTASVMWTERGKDKEFSLTTLVGERSGGRS